MTDINNTDKHIDSFYLDNLKDLMPYRFKNGFSGAFTYFLMGLVADTVAQLQDDGLYFQWTDHPNSPNDYLQTAGKQNGIIRFLGDDDRAFRERLKRKWETIPNYGQEEPLKEAIKINLDPDGTKGITVNILFGLPANGTPIDPPFPGGEQIDTYPNSNDYKSQFIVSIRTTQNLAPEGQEQTLSNVVSDLQLRTIREIIRLTKPVQWVCREIILYSLLSYDTPGVFYDGTYNYLDGDNLGTVTDPTNPVGFINERHRGY